MGKRFLPRISVWILLILSMLIDLLNMLFSEIWITHGLTMALIWTAIAGGITAISVAIINSKQAQNDKNFPKYDIKKITIMCSILVFAHWILDFIAWPMSAISMDFGMQIPLFFADSPATGLGVYSSLAGALIMDIGIFLIGLFVYIRYRLRIKDGKKDY